MKKILRNSIFALSSIMALMQLGNNSLVIKDTHFIEDASSSQLVGAKSVKKLIGSDEEVANSKIYTQYAELDNSYVLRFATAVKGDINSISFTRASVRSETSYHKENIKEVATVYRGIIANNETYFYDGTDLTTDESKAGNYYWACYTISYGKDSDLINSLISINVSINGEIKESTQKSLIEIKNYDEAHTHSYTDSIKDINGIKYTYHECECGTYYFEDYKETHTWVDEDPKCQDEDCDAYRIKYNGEYYVIDDQSIIPFGNCIVNGKVSNSNDATAANKNSHLSSILANPNTFATQASTAPTIQNDGTVWTIKNNSGGNFTRFNLGINGTSYVGKFILSVDMKVAKENIAINRFGVKITDNNATVTDADNQPKLVGKTEEGNSSRIFEANTTYRFTYVFETTAVDQLVQIFTDTAAATDVELSNLHVIPLEGNDNVVMGNMLYFGKASDCYVKQEECPHNFVDDTCILCGFSKITFKVNDKSFENGWKDVNPGLKENPGTWALQSATNLTCSNNATNNTLIANSKADSTRNRNAFMRFIPAIDGEPYVGKYIIEFDITVASATDTTLTEAELTVGFCMQTVNNASIIAVKDTAKVFTIGTTYRFAAIIETNDAEAFMQFNIRNLQKYGTKVVISNPAIQYVDNTPVETPAITNLAFGVVAKEKLI